MRVTELNREQLIQLKQHYLTMKNDEAGEGTSYLELAEADTLVSDQEIFEAEADTDFSEGGFFRMKAYLLDVENRERKAVEIDDSDRLNEYYSLLNCSLIDIQCRKIGGKWFDIICDDEALLKAEPIVSAVDSDGKPALCGNLLFCNYDDSTGEEVSLTDEDIQHLESFTRLAVKKDLEGNELDILLVMSCVDYE